MKTSSLLSILGALLSFAVTGFAQGTYSTIGNAFTGQTGLGGNTAVQTFSGLTSLTGMTWQVTNSSGGSQIASFNAYVGVWNATSGSLVGSLSAIGGTFTTPSVSNGANQLLTFSAAPFALDGSQTYALILSQTGGAFNFVANLTTNTNGSFFSSGGIGSAGTTLFNAGSIGSFETALQGANGAPDLGKSYSMSIDGTLAPAPEPATAAAAFAALFVAAGMSRRIWKRRQSAAPVPVAA